MYLNKPSAVLYAVMVPPVRAVVPVRATLTESPTLRVCTWLATSTRVDPETEQTQVVAGAEQAAAVGQLDPHRDSPAFDLRCRQDRNHAAREVLAGKRGQRHVCALPDPDKTRLRLRHGGHREVCRFRFGGDRHPQPRQPAGVLF